MNIVELHIYSVWLRSKAESVLLTSCTNAIESVLIQASPAYRRILFRKFYLTLTGM